MLQCTCQILTQKLWIAQRVDAHTCTHVHRPCARIHKLQIQFEHSLEAQSGEVKKIGTYVYIFVEI